MKIECFAQLLGGGAEEPRRRREGGKISGCIPIQKQASYGGCHALVPSPPLGDRTDLLGINLLGTNLLHA